jgi:prepilin-type N-terminal cleavage/methylation domain-containing protein
MTPRLHSFRQNRSRGFTLVEVLIAMGIFGIVSVALLSVFIQSLNIYHYDVGKIQVNRDIRTFTSKMSTDATYANYFLIYPNFSTRTNTSTVTDPTTGATTSVVVDASVNDGLSGEFLVLVFKDDSDDTKVSRLIGYYRAPTSTDTNSEGPVRRFDITISPSSNATVWTLLPAVSTINDNPEVVELSKGMSNGKLFYNFYDKSIMVKGQIIHRGSMMRRATNTYNFTVSPRG